MATHHERRVTIPSDIWDSIGYYVVDERLKLPNEIRDSVTHESVICGIMKAKMTEAKHYPPPPRTAESGSKPIHKCLVGGGGVDQP